MNSATSVKKDKWLFRHRWTLMSVWIVLFSVASISLFVSNKHRINDVQQSRVDSCRETYQSFPLMFQPFFPRERTQWTDEQRRNWKKLQDRANQLAAKCGQQVKPHKH